MLDRVRGGQGVRAVAASSTAPLTGAPNRGMRIEGDPVLPPDQQPNADFQLITPDYFRALGITLVAGRAFDASDRADTPPVLVVNQALVDRYFAGRDPIGHVILFGGNKRHEIVGVVADARYRSVEQPGRPDVLPAARAERRALAVPRVHGLDRRRRGATRRRPPCSASAVREADPQQPISRLRTIEEILSGSMAERRFNTWIVGAVRGDRATAGGGRHLRRDGVRGHEPDARARRARRARRDARRI